MNYSSYLGFILPKNNGGNYGSPLVANSATDMIDHEKVYVYTGSEIGYVAGNWYYWNGISWTSGGVYNSQALSEEIENELTDLKSDLPDIAFPLSDFSNDWTGTSYSATLKKEKNVFTISGTRKSTYRAYSIMGDALVVSSDTNY